MTTLSSEFLAQSTMPLRPFMGKLMSVITDTAGSLWMLATAGFTQTHQQGFREVQYTIDFIRYVIQVVVKMLSQVLSYLVDPGHNKLLYRSMFMCCLFISG